MIKVIMGVTAAAIMVVGVVSITKGKPHDAPTSQLNPLQMMASQNVALDQRVTDLSLVFE